MENHSLEDMRSVWQETFPPGMEALDDSPGWQDVLARLQQYERRVFRINLVKTVASVTILLLAGGIVIPGHADSWLVLGGLGWIVLNALVFLALYWRWQFQVHTMPLHWNTMEFIQIARNGLMRERKLFRRFMPLFGLAMIIGLQVIYLGILQGYPLPSRILSHVVSVLALLAALAGGLRFRQRRFQREMQPLLDQLDLLKTSWQENG